MKEQQLSIPIFRAKAKCIHMWKGFNKQSLIEDGDYVIGSLIKDCEFSDSGITRYDVYFIRIPYGDSYTNVEIDPSTLSIHLPNLLAEDSNRLLPNGEKDIRIFVSLSKQGGGADLIKRQDGKKTCLVYYFYEEGLLCSITEETLSSHKRKPVVDLEIQGIKE